MKQVLTGMQGALPICVLSCSPKHTPAPMDHIPDAQPELQHHVLLKNVLSDTVFAFISLLLLLLLQCLQWFLISIILTNSEIIFQLICSQGRKVKGDIFRSYGHMTKEN